MITNKEIIFRLILSAIVGGLVGMEREANNRPAGLRTHILVTLGSSLIMLMSMNGFHNLPNVGDPARLAAQVVSGIGFLGAGTILRQGNSIKGLTTAASLWVCAGIGLAIGGGYYVGGLATVVIALFSLMSLGAFERKIRSEIHKVLVLQCRERPGLIGDIGHMIGSYNATIRDIRIVRNVGSDDMLTLTDLVEFEEKIELHIKLIFKKDLEMDKFLKELNSIKNIDSSSWMNEAE